MNIMCGPSNSSQENGPLAFPFVWYPWENGPLESKENGFLKENGPFEDFRGPFSQYAEANFKKSYGIRDKY